MKEINAALMKKLEEMRGQQQKLKKQHNKEVQDKLAEAYKKVQEMESEIQVLKEMVKAGKIQLKTKDTDLQRLNIKIKRLEKTAEIREAIIGQTLDTKMTMKDGIPNYSNAVSPRPFKSANRKIAESPAPQISLHTRNDSPSEGKSLQAPKTGFRNGGSQAALETAEPLTLPPIAGKPPAAPST